MCRISAVQCRAAGRHAPVRACPPHLCNRACHLNHTPPLRFACDLAAYYAFLSFHPILDERTLLDPRDLVSAHSVHSLHLYRVVAFDLAVRSLRTTKRTTLTGSHSHSGLFNSGTLVAPFQVSQTYIPFPGSICAAQRSATPTFGPLPSLLPLPRRRLTFSSCPISID
jgi:hypothetical protein